MITLALNLAATGLSRTGPLDDPRFPRPVALGAVQWDSNGPFSRYQGLIRQEDVSVSASAEAAHGVTDRMARSRGVPERTALSWLTNSLRTSTYVIGWDLEFDLDVIRAALIRHGGNPAQLIRPGLIDISLQAYCAPIVGKQDEAGGQALPTITESIKAIAPDAGIEAGDVLARAEACRAIFEALCARELIPDMEKAA
jgi:DNA polymerase-3 subunit alpha